MLKPQCSKLCAPHTEGDEFYNKDSVKTEHCECEGIRLMPWIYRETDETSVFRRTYSCHAADKHVDPSALIAGLNK